MSNLMMANELFFFSILPILFDIIFTPFQIQSFHGLTHFTPGGQVEFINIQKSNRAK